VFFGVIAPGTVSDQVAHEDTGLSNLIESLPPGLFIIAEAAYTLTEHVLVPFTGSNHLHKEKDAFNCFLSQLCVRIEMACGLLTTKWSILCCKLECSLKRNIDIIHACAILHNYGITNDYYDDFDEEDLVLGGPHIAAMEDSPLGWGYLPTVEAFVPTLDHRTHEMPLFDTSSVTGTAVLIIMCSVSNKSKNCIMKST
jgi:hypothetical protein